MFQDWLETWPHGWPDASSYDVELDGDDDGLQTARWVLDHLEDCTDILPSGDCDQLGIPKGSTYAYAVRYIRQHVPDPELDREEEEQLWEAQCDTLADAFKYYLDALAAGRSLEELTEDALVVVWAEPMSLIEACETMAAPPEGLMGSVDIMPGTYCDALDLERGSNYLDGANAILEWYDRTHG
jgi:hypothetical protein